MAANPLALHLLQVGFTCSAKRDRNIHALFSSLGRVFSAITRLTSATGTNSRRPIFTLATVPE
jgi:hypothetical protein